MLDTNRLPATFIKNMKELLNDDYPLYEASMKECAYSGLRVNTSKISLGEFETICPYEIEKVPFVSNGYYIKDTALFSRHPFYYAGLYYLTEPSAMLPADRIPIESSDCVLDLCAAPGGKSTGIICKSPNVLISNDISYSRALALTKNIEYSGCGDVYVCVCDPSELSKVYPEYFDKILVDAPCSGEGMFRRDPALIDSWLNKGPKEYSEIQKQILDEAVTMLKPGGMLLYSTCTFSPFEDEEVIDYILKKHSDVHTHEIEDYEGFVHSNSNLFEGSGNCIKVFPHKMKGEGHFLTLLRKDISNAASSNIDVLNTGHAFLNRGKTLCSKDLTAEEQSFFSNLKDGELLNRLFMRDNCLYLLPKGYESRIRDHIRYIRTGTLIGTRNDKGRFNPHTGFALSLKADDFANALNLKVDDERVIRYLKGETIFAHDGEAVMKGFTLILVEGYPLGFAKFDGSKFKNLYEKGWRMC